MLQSAKIVMSGCTDKSKENDNKVAYLRFGTITDTMKHFMQLFIYLFFSLINCQ